VLKWVEGLLRQERYARLAIEFDASGPSEAEIRRRLGDSGLSIVKCDVSVDALIKRRTLDLEIREFRRATNSQSSSMTNCARGWNREASAERHVSTASASLPVAAMDNGLLRNEKCSGRAAPL